MALHSMTSSSFGAKAQCRRELHALWVMASQEKNQHRPEMSSDVILMPTHARMLSKAKHAYAIICYGMAINCQKGGFGIQIGCSVAQLVKIAARKPTRYCRYVHHLRLKFAKRSFHGGLLSFPFSQPLKQFRILAFQDSVTLILVLLLRSYDKSQWNQVALQSLYCNLWPRDHLVAHVKASARGLMTDHAKSEVFYITILTTEVRSLEASFGFTSHRLSGCITSQDPLQQSPQSPKSWSLYQSFRSLLSGLMLPLKHWKEYSLSIHAFPCQTAAMAKVVKWNSGASPYAGMTWYQKERNFAYIFEQLWSANFSKFMQFTSRRGIPVLEAFWLPIKDFAHSARLHSQWCDWTLTEHRCLISWWSVDDTCIELYWFLNIVLINALIVLCNLEWPRLCCTALLVTATNFQASDLEKGVPGWWWLWQMFRVVHCVTPKNQWVTMLLYNAVKKSTVKICKAIDPTISDLEKQYDYTYIQILTKNTNALRQRPLLRLMLGWHSVQMSGRKIS